MLFLKSAYVSSAGLKLTLKFDSIIAIHPLNIQRLIATTIAQVIINIDMIPDLIKEFPCFESDLQITNNE